VQRIRGLGQEGNQHDVGCAWVVLGQCARAPAREGAVVARGSPVGWRSATGVVFRCAGGNALGLRDVDERAAVAMQVVRYRAETGGTTHIYTVCI
jgi:hypothetical protein